MVFAIRLDSQDAFLQISKMGMLNSFCNYICKGFCDNLRNFVLSHHIKKLCEHYSGRKHHSTN